MNRGDYDIVIVGGGPAGLTAAIYGGRARLRTVLIEKMLPGGQLLNTGAIENYPGFLSITGPDLARRMEEQARAFGAEFLTRTVEEIRRADSDWLVRTMQGEEYRAPVVIFCAGGRPKKLGVPGETELINRGISWCAVCDGPLFRDQVVAVVGGGDSAVGEAIYLARFAGKVHILNNDDELEASPLLQQRAYSDPKIEVHFSALVQEIGGKERVEWVLIRNPKDGSTSKLDVGGVFEYIGWRPNSDLLRGLVELDERGYVITDWRMMTSAPGLFAAGDVIQHTMRQITNAAGDGTTAALQAYEYIQELRPRPAVSAGRRGRATARNTRRGKRAA